MHTKISSDFWSHPEIEPAPSDVKLAALWLLTNERMRMCGYAEITEKRFAFETDLSPDLYRRTLEALPKTFQALSKGYLAPNFIRWQFGTGPSLAKNNMAISVVKDLHKCPPDVVAMVLSLYPELGDVYERVCRQALAEGSASPSQGQREGEGEGEGTREGVREGDRSGGSKPRPARPRGGSTRPDQHPEPVRSRMIAVADLLKRRPDSLWSEAEKKALGAAGLLALEDSDFAEQVDTMRRFYRATIPEAKRFQFTRRSTVPILLNNWPGELDKARAWRREAGGESDGVTKV